MTDLKQKYDESTVAVMRQALNEVVTDRQARPTRPDFRPPVHNRFPTHSNLPASVRPQGMQCISKSS
jgi:hypothetical protein